MTHPTLLLPGAALVVLALAAPLSAQDTRPAAPPEDGPVRQVPPAEDIPLDPAAARRAAAAEAGQDVDPAPMRREIMSKLREGEIRHRERLATIHRLKQIAESQGDAERLALLDKLEVKEGASYNAKTQFTAVRLANTTTYKQTLIKLADGRIRRNVPAEEPAKSKLTPEQRAEKQRAKRAANKPPERKKPADKPKADEPQDAAPKEEAPKPEEPKAQRRQQAQTQTQRAQSQTPAARAATASSARPAAAPPAARTESRKAAGTRKAQAPRQPASRSGTTASSGRSPRSGS